MESRQKAGRRRGPMRRRPLIWSGAALMAVAVALLATAVFSFLTGDGEEATSTSHRASKAPSVSAHPTASVSPGVTPESPGTPSPPGSDSPRSRRSPTPTVTVTQFVQVPVAGAGGPELITAIGGLITAGVGAASFLVGMRRRDRREAERVQPPAKGS